MTMNNLMLPTRTSEPFNNNFSQIFKVSRNQSVDSFFGDNDRRGGIYEDDPFDQRRGQRRVYRNPEYSFEGRNINDNPLDGRDFYTEPDYPFDKRIHKNPEYSFQGRNMNDNQFDGRGGLYNDQVHPFDGSRKNENPQMLRNQTDIQRINRRHFPSFSPKLHKPMWPWLIFLPLAFLLLEVFNC